MVFCLLSVANKKLFLITCVVILYLAQNHSSCNIARMFHCVAMFLVVFLVLSVANNNFISPLYYYILAHSHICYNISSLPPLLPYNTRFSYIIYAKKNYSLFISFTVGIFSGLSHSFSNKSKFIQYKAFCHTVIHLRSGANKVIFFLLRFRFLDPFL